MVKEKCQKEAQRAAEAVINNFDPHCFLFIFLCHVLLLFFHTPANAFTLSDHNNYSNPIFYIKTFTISDSELPDNEVTALLETSDKILWVGTWSRGLSRFHKGQWLNFTKNNSDLPDNRVSALIEASDKALWIGTYGSGLTRFHKGQWQVFTKENSDLPDNRISSLVETSDKALWVGTLGGGLARFHKGKWQVFNKKSRSLISSLVETFDKALWVGTLGGGLARFYEGQWQVFTKENSNLPDNDVRALAETSDKSLWVGTWRGGLVRFYKGQWQVFNKKNTNYFKGVSTLIETPDKALWVGTWGDGLAQFHKGQWQVFTKENSNLPDNKVSAFIKTSDGALWVGTLGGIAYFQKEKWQVFTKENSNLPYNDIRALIETSDGALWIGTWGGGLARLHKGQWQVFTKENSNLPYNDIRALIETSDGALWIGTWGGGVARFHKGQWQVFTKENTLLPDNVVTALVETSNKILWVGTLGGGLARFYNGQWQAFTKENSELSGNVVLALMETSDMALWVSTLGGGLSRFYRGQWQVFTKENSGLPYHDIQVRALMETSDKALWVGTLGGGLARFYNRQWKVFTKENSGLPCNDVKNFIETSDKALWVGTLGGGLACFHKGQWQVFTKENSLLPDNRVITITESSDRSLWIGTSGGLARFRPSQIRPNIELIGPSEKEPLTQSQQTLAAFSFDPEFRTEPEMFQYHWTIISKSKKILHNSVTRSPFLTYTFEDGFYTVEVRSIDQYGYQSESKKRSFKIITPKPAPSIYGRLKEAGIISFVVSLVYLFALFPLLRIYSKSSWARTFVNSGLFNKFPLLHKSILNSQWARRHLFLKFVQLSSHHHKVPNPYIPQMVYHSNALQAEAAMPIDELDNVYACLFSSTKHIMILGRSGTGKTVLLRYLNYLAAQRLHQGKTHEFQLPVLINLRTHPIAGRNIEDVICDEIRGQEVELPDDVIKFILKKGGFLLLFDSLNEVDTGLLKNEFQSFLNRNAHNKVLMASQLDFLERKDIEFYTIAEITTEQAKEYLNMLTNSDPWERLFPEVRMLARNPQDLGLIGEILQALPPEEVPANRADLYRELLYRDRALKSWVKSESIEVLVIYRLAFYMIDEVKSVLSEDELTRVVRRLLEEHQISEGAIVDNIVSALHKSHLFRHEQIRGKLGIPQNVIGFQHELIGKFLAARYLCSYIEAANKEISIDLITLSNNPRWLDVFFFVIDELNSSRELNQLLMNLMKAGGLLRTRMVAYAIGTKPAELIQNKIRESYREAKIKADLRQTPAAFLENCE
jgi:ligand-binding sensor domain-containing protein